MNRVRRGFLGLSLLWMASFAASAEDVLIGAAVSLRAPMETLSHRFQLLHPETRIRLVFGASSNLARQIESGAPIAIFASADESWIRQLISVSRVEESDYIRIAVNTLVVATRSGADFKIESFSDLFVPEIRRIALPAQAVPLGRYARAWLSAHGWEERLDGRVMVTEHSVATLRAVAQSHVDAAIVYETDANLSANVEIAYRIPPNEQPEIVYSVALIRDARESEGTRAFYDYLGGPEAALILAEAGFRPIHSAGPAEEEGPPAGPEE